MKMRTWLVIGCMIVAAMTVQVLEASASQPQPCGRRVVYEGKLGSLPDAQRMTYVAIGIGATQALTQDGVILDTMPANSIYAGYSIDASNPPVLNRTAGYTLTFELAVLDEMHTNPNRAGFNVIVLSNDKLGIELAFWANEIWVQNGPPALFTRAESVSVDTSAGRRYTLAIQRDRYVLSAGNNTLLSGLLRDYTSFEGPIDPYETPNFTFMGDNSTSSRARVKLGFVALSFKPCMTRLPITTRAP